VTVDVSGEDGRYRAEVDVEGDELPCCEAGHAGPEEAARHAWRLTRALARKTASAS